MQRPRPAAAIAILVASSLALTGCGGSEGTKTVTVAAKASTAPTPPPPPTKAEDKRLARAAVLRINDMPTNWASDDDDPPNQPAGATKCKGLQAVRGARSGRGHSGGFTHGQQSRAEQAVYVFPDEQTATTAFADLTSQASRKCSNRGTEKNARSSAREEATVRGFRSSLVKTAGLGDEEVGSRVSLLFEMYGSEDSVDFDTIQTRVGRAISLLDFYDVDDADRAKVQRAAIRGLTERVNGD